MKIYLASSWRNEGQQAAVRELREAGHDVYDFRNPAPGNTGFSWSAIDPNWKQWSAEQFALALEHPIAREGFTFDMEALRTCDACIMLQPCGRSAALELGYAVGARKLTIAVLAEGQEPELMLSMAHNRVHSIADAIAWLNGARPWRPVPQDAGGLAFAGALIRGRNFVELRLLERGGAPIARLTMAPAEMRDALREGLAAIAKHEGGT